MWLIYQIHGVKSPSRRCSPGLKTSQSSVNIVNKLKGVIVYIQFQNQINAITNNNNSIQVKLKSTIPMVTVSTYSLHAIQLNSSSLRSGWQNKTSLGHENLKSRQYASQECLKSWDGSWKQDRELNLTTNDGDGRQGIPESREGARVSMVSESRASSLYLVYQRYQILHLPLFPL